MLTASADFGTMVEGVEQTRQWRIQITLPAGVYSDFTLAVDHIGIDASTTSDMPENTRLQVGYPAMSCDFTLSGLVDVTDESKTAAWLFGRYSTGSPLYHLDALYSAVTVDLGLYTASAGGTPEYVRKFTGVIDTYTANEDGSVSFSCVDAVRSAMRSIPDMSTIGIAHDPNISTEFVLDAICRSATGGAISSWPAQRPNSVLAIGFRSSILPEVGSIGTGGNGSSFVPGVFGTALKVKPGQLVFSLGSTVTFDLSTTTHVHLECWVTGLAGSTDIEIDGGSNHWIQVGYDATAGNVFGNVNLTGTDHIVNVSAPGIGSGGHYLAGDFTITIDGAGVATWSGTGHIDGTNYSFGSGNSGGTISTPHLFTTATFFVTGPAGTAPTIEAWQISTETSPSSNATFAPRAVIDPSLNQLTIIPPISAGDPWQVIQQIADAELAVAGGDESGRFVFYNRDTLRGAASSRDISSSASLTAVGGVETPAASVVNHASVEYVPWTLDGADSLVYSLDVVTKVPANSEIVLTPTVDTPVAGTDESGPLQKLADGATPTAGYYRASTDSAGTAEHPGLFIGTNQTVPDALRIMITNRTSQAAWLVSPANYLDVPAGTPMLGIFGLKVNSGGTITSDYQYPPVNADGTGGAKTSRFGEVAYQLSGNPWIQDGDTALQLAQDIVVDQAVPRPNLTGVSIVPDPRIQLTDVVHIKDPDRTLVDEYARVFGWTITWTGGDPDTYEMTIDARTLAAPGGWIMGVAGRSEVGSTTYVYPSV